MAEKDTYPRGVGQLQREIVNEKNGGKNKKRQECEECHKLFYAVKDEETLRGRPRKYCSKCRLVKVRFMRSNYDKAKRLLAKKSIIAKVQARRKLIKKKK